jgi:hypothetical protein
MFLSQKLGSTMGIMPADRSGTRGSPEFIAPVLALIVNWRTWIHSLSPCGARILLWGECYRVKGRVFAPRFLFIVCTTC